MDEDQGVATTEEGSHIHCAERGSPRHHAPPTRMPHGVSQCFHHQLSGRILLPSTYFHQSMVMAFLGLFPKQLTHPLECELHL